VEEGFDNVAKKIDEAGKGFTKSVKSNVSTALKDILTGNKDFGEASQVLLGSIASSIIDQFVEGLMSRAEGGIEEFLNTMGEGIWGVAADSEKQKVIFEGTKDKEGRQATSFKSLWADFKGMFDSKETKMAKANEEAKKLAEADLTKSTVLTASKLPETLDTKTNIATSMAQCCQPCSCSPGIPNVGKDQSVTLADMPKLGADEMMAFTEYKSIPEITPPPFDTELEMPSIPGMESKPFSGANGLTQSMTTPFQNLFPSLSGGRPPWMTPPIVPTSGVALPKDGSLPGTGQGGIGAVTSGIGTLVNLTQAGNEKSGGFWGILLGFMPMILSSLISSSASGIMEGIGGLFSIAAANGGIIRGPGTSTSDSIPAMLSNGEFIMNAKSTSKHLKLLKKLNMKSGGLIDVKKYSEGGLVGMALVTPPPSSAMPEKTLPKKGDSTIVNLNITGDISRQTKSEVMRMLPSIAEGVNGHNREKGYKG